MRVCTCTLDAHVHWPRTFQAPLLNLHACAKNICRPLMGTPFTSFSLPATWALSWRAYTGGSRAALMRPSWALGTTTRATGTATSPSWPCCSGCSPDSALRECALCWAGGGVAVRQRCSHASISLRMHWH